jgi:hypothetical protein
MSERPILFSAPMVRAILDGRKTQTRRVVKLPSWSVGAEIEIDDDGFPLILCAATGCLATIACPYGAPGDRLWVRERFSYGFLATGGAIGNSFVHFYDGGQKYFDGAYYDPKNHAKWDPTKLRWKPSIHMPRWASRINIEVTGVRVERLQDISRDDEIAEGTPDGQFFDSIWSAIHGDDSWAANPWVRVIEFKRVTA